jgi:hypothetical protein
VCFVGPTDYDGNFLSERQWGCGESESNENEKAISYITFLSCCFPRKSETDQSADSWREIRWLTVDENVMPDAPGSLVAQ